MVILRWAKPSERPKIQQYLFEKMGKVSFENWANILDCRWNKTDDRYGVVVEENGKLAGFLGIIFADRMFNNEPHRTGNITSWYLEKHLRRGGLGQDMLELITQDNGVTYIATSANFRSGALLKKIGWQVMEDKRLFWHRSLTTQYPDCYLVTGEEQVLVHGDLSENAKHIIQAHKGLNITYHLLICPQITPLFFCTYMKVKGQKDTPNFEILYAEDRASIGQNIQVVADLILPDETCVLSSDSRFIDGESKAAETAILEVPRFFKPAKNLLAEQISFIFSEVLLLDLKVY